jgi:hypothetical protein
MIKDFDELMAAASVQADNRGHVRDVQTFASRVFMP